MFSETRNEEDECSPWTKRDEDEENINGSLNSREVEKENTFFRKGAYDKI